MVGTTPPNEESTFALLRRLGAPAVAGTLDCLLAANVHGLYCVPQSSVHRPACQAILGGGVWEPDTVTLVSGTDPSGDIVTAGAFFGDMLPAFARSRIEGARVWAFEPNRENFRCAQITVALNDLLAVTLAHAALGAERGVADLAVADALGTSLGGGSHITNGGTSVDVIERVRVVPIDDAVPADCRVAVILLDLEGFEQQALAGAVRTIDRCRPLIVVESVPSPAWFDEHLAPLGYRAEGTVHWNSVYRATPTFTPPGDRHGDQPE